MYKAIAANKRNTVIIMALFVLIIGGLGWLASQIYADPIIMYIVLGVAGAYTLFQYFAASKLAVAMNGAKEIEKKDNPRLWRIVENLSIATGMSMPKVYVMDDPAPNAFATGRDPKHAIVAATTGLINMMDDSELEAVMAHELGHVKNYDIRVSMIIFGLVSAIGMLADMFMYMFLFGGDRKDVPPQFMLLGIVAIVIAPLIATIVQLAVSRQREYLADATGVMTTRYPDGLASALEKIRDHGSAMKKQHSATAHLFFANPMKANFWGKLFSTHPPIDERIARLRNMGDRM